jgi:hypothetical protein
MRSSLNRGGLKGFSQNSWSTKKKVVPKNEKMYGLSNETSLKNIGRDLFVSRFYTKTVQKEEKY